MESIQTRLALASQRAAGQRSFQILGDHDLPRLEAFFLSFDFDQRRGYFGGGISSPYRNGQPCRAAAADDPLEAINVRIVGRTTDPDKAPPAG